MEAKISRWVAQVSQRLDLAVSVNLGRSRSFAKFQIESKAVSVNGKGVEKPSFLLKPGDEVEIKVVEEAQISLEPIAKDLEILFEDEHCLVINKPQGWVVHPASGHKGETLVNYLLHHFKENAFRESASLRPGIVHRLDKGTSGCLVIARNRPALENLSAQFKDRKVEKEYEAIVWGKMKETGIFTGAIGRHHTDRKKMTTKQQGGREASTRWSLAWTDLRFSHVKLFPLTGRTHQLRVHLAEAGHAIVGDPVYGKRNRPLDKLPLSVQQLLTGLEFPFLHARRLVFFHPVTQKRVEFLANRPTQFSHLLEELVRAKGIQQS